MSFEGSLATRNAAVNAVTALANSGFIEVYSGTRPATPDTALSGNTLLATLTFGSTAFGAGSSGVATANAITSGTAAATGTASFARVYASNGTTVIGDCSCGTSGSDLNFPTLSFVTGATISCTSLTLTQS
jgi:glutamate synthase domain-containing protein 3